MIQNNGIHPIIVSHATKSFASTSGFGPRAKALTDVSLELHWGEILGLVGPNGAGKTTLMRSILRLIRLDSGTVTISGTDHQSPAWKSAVGYLPEDFRAEAHATPLDILWLMARLRSLDTKQAAERIQELLIMFDMQQYQRKSITTFSKGMLLRLGFSQAIIHRPSILLLDEPTNGLDPVGKKMVFDLLDTLRNEGCAILLSSHQLSEVERLSDRVAMMYHGRISILTDADKASSEGNLEERFFKQFREEQQ